LGETAGEEKEQWKLSGDRGKGSRASANRIAERKGLLLRSDQSGTGRFESSPSMGKGRKEDTSEDSNKRLRGRS